MSEKAFILACAGCASTNQKHTHTHTYAHAEHAPFARRRQLVVGSLLGAAARSACTAERRRRLVKLHRLTSCTATGARDGRNQFPEGEPISLIEDKSHRPQSWLVYDATQPLYLAPIDLSAANELSRRRRPVPAIRFARKTKPKG